MRFSLRHVAATTAIASLYLFGASNLRDHWVVEGPKHFVELSLAIPVGFLVIAGASLLWYGRAWGPLLMSFGPFRSLRQQAAIAILSNVLCLTLTLFEADFASVAAWAVLGVGMFLHGSTLASATYLFDKGVLIPDTGTCRWGRRRVWLKESGGEWSLHVEGSWWSPGRSTTHVPREKVGEVRAILAAKQGPREEPR